MATAGGAHLESNTPQSGGLFVTGMLRSGTTLLDKLLHRHPSLWVASQPFFNFYAGVKSEFLKPAVRQLPFTPGFMEPAQGDFQAWLEHTVFDGRVLAALEAACTDGKGQGAPSLRGRIRNLVRGDCIGVWSQLHSFVAAAYGAPARGGQVGSKEVLCEEFLPYLAARGVRCLLTVRDPRAVIASLNRGYYRESVGDTYPILLNIRNWRKSVAYLFWAQRQPRVLGLRYEDLVLDGERILERIARFLEVPPFDPAWYRDGLMDQEGKPWQGNSSFDLKRSLDAGSLEQWRKELDADTVRFIEFCTYPELKALGYSVGSDAWDPGVLARYRENTAQLRQDYLADYAITPANLAAEARRRELLLSGTEIDRAERRSLFLFDEAHAALYQALRNG